MQGNNIFCSNLTQKKTDQHCDQGLSRPVHTQQQPQFTLHREQLPHQIKEEVGFNSAAAKSKNTLRNRRNSYMALNFIQLFFCDSYSYGLLKIMVVGKNNRAIIVLRTSEAYFPHRAYNKF